MSQMVKITNMTPETTVLDIGGLPDLWDLCPLRPKITFLNLNPPPTNRPDWIQGNGCHLPFPDNSFDLCFSNSVIEHLGNADDQRLFAREMQRVGHSYWAQTPNFWFPIEPHFMGPGIQWVPKRHRARLAKYFSLYGLERPEKMQPLVEEVRLLKRSEMRTLFPDGNIFAERFAGLAKSIMAYGPTET